MAPRKIELLLAHIGSLNRKALVRMLSHFDGRLRLDFTREYLDAQSEERLRHILAAALLCERRAG